MSERVCLGSEYGAGVGGGGAVRGRDIYIGLGTKLVQTTEGGGMAISACYL